jgi:hypothetical protein
MQLKEHVVPEIGKTALFSEAQLIRHLFDAYLDDRRFLKLDKRNRILVFLDSNEIKAYVDADAPNSMIGFVFRFEALEDGGLSTETRNPKRVNEIALRHDQILNGLLFDPSRACGILSSHEEEMEREVRFLETKYFDRVLKLVQRARAEITKDHRETGMRYASAAKHDPEHNGDLVRFVQSHAPALTAILSDSLSSPFRRMRAVLENSSLTLFDEMPWVDLDVSREVANILSAVEPTAADVTDQRKMLRGFDFRKNSLEANYIDSSALAQLSLVRKSLAANNIRHIRVVLVTRARTLLRAAVDIARGRVWVQGGNSTSALAVRHPRMLALSLEQAAVLDDAANLSLGTAIDLWRTQLHALPSTQLEQSVIQTHLNAFIQAWDSFESSRLAMETSWRQGQANDGKASEQSKFAQSLIDIFCSVNPEKKLRDGILKDFMDYGSAANKFLLSRDALQLRARISNDSGSDRVTITPLAEAPAGPIQLTVNHTLATAREDLLLEHIAEVAIQSEQPLIWALSCACAAEWQQGGIFAESALKLSNFETDPAVRCLIEDEARLLRAEIRRLGGDTSSRAAASAPTDELPTPLDRFEQSQKELAQVSDRNSARRTREAAAQLVEASLLGATISDLGEKLVDSFAKLGEAADASHNISERVRCIALQLVLYLFDRRYLVPSGNPALRRHESRVKVRHKQLRTLIQQIQEIGHLDVTPRRAKAMELIGYTLLDLPLPADSRTDLTDLQRGLESCTDAIGRVLRDELERIHEREFQTFHPELSLAPIPFPNASELLDSCDSATREAANRVDEIGWRLLSTGPNIKSDRELDGAIKKLAAGLTQLGAGVSETGFVLRGYLHYAQLLKATMEPRHVRPARYAQLRDTYAEFSVQYPDDVLPLIRLAFVSEKLGEQSRVKEALTRAIDLLSSADGGSPHSPHWIQSLVRRRYGSLVVLPRRIGADSVWNKALPHPDAAAEAEVLTEICKLLFDAEDADNQSTGADADAGPPEAPEAKAHAKERERRWNNIVYFSSRLIERVGIQANSDVINYERVCQFANMLVKSIRGQPNLSVLHTIGCYYSAVGRMEDLCNVAKQMMEIGVKNDLMSGLGSNENLEEFWGWFKAGLAAER